jgi:hypothetical protein
MSDNEMDDIWERINLVADEVGGISQRKNGVGI